jgi:hypothetical protein
MREFSQRDSGSEIASTRLISPPLGNIAVAQRQTAVGAASRLRCFPYAATVRAQRQRNVAGGNGVTDFGTRPNRLVRQRGIADLHSNRIKRFRMGGVRALAAERDQPQRAVTNQEVAHELVPKWHVVATWST